MRVRYRVRERDRFSSSSSQASHYRVTTPNQSHEPRLSLPKTKVKSEGSGNVFGLAIDNRTRAHSRTHSPILNSLISMVFQKQLFLFYAGYSDNTWVVIVKPAVAFLIQVSDKDCYS